MTDRHGITDIEPSSTVLYLVRHGETLANRERHFNTHDTPLTDVGREQAVRVAERLAGEAAFDAIYASDLARTMETGTLIGGRIGRRPVALAALRELDCGDWKGRTRSEIEAEHPGRLEGWVAGGGAERMPGEGGECVADVAARITAGFDEIVRRHPGGRVVVVSHGWALAILLAAIHEWDHAAAFSSRRVSLGNTAVSVVEVDAAGARRCTLLGCTRHLDAEPLAEARPA